MTRYVVDYAITNVVTGSKIVEADTPRKAERLAEEYYRLHGQIRGTSELSESRDLEIRAVSRIGTRRRRAT